MGMCNPSRALEEEACGVLRCAVELVETGLNQPDPVRLDDLWILALRLEKCRQDWQAGWLMNGAREPQGLSACP